MFTTIPKNIYNALFNIIENDANFAEVVTKQRGFYHRDPLNIPPTMYPWIFIEFGGYTSVEMYRMPRVWEYEFTIPVVGMTHADMGDPTNLVFNDGVNENDGIGDLAAVLGAVFWARKEDHFGVDGVIDWTIARTGTPNVMAVQSVLLTNPFVRGIQMDLAFQIREEDQL